MITCNCTFTVSFSTQRYQSFNILYCSFSLYRQYTDTQITCCVCVCSGFIAFFSMTDPNISMNTFKFKQRFKHAYIVQLCKQFNLYTKIYIELHPIYVNFFAGARHEERRTTTTRITHYIHIMHTYLQFTYVLISSVVLIRT